LLTPLAARVGSRFSILLGSDVTAHNVYARIAAIVEASGPNDTVLFYFSGHGGFSKGRDYLLFMSDSDIHNPSTVLTARDLAPALQTRRDGATLVFIDSSFAAAFVGGGALM
jgi:uncharacterized caspase-like protein